MEKVIVITGPTAVGKTKLSLAIAKELNTEIINGDAFQVYRNLNIGTAKLSPSEQKLIKHHLIDILNPNETFSIFEYQTIVRKLIAKMTEEGKIPLIVGGSGLYLDSVIYDYRLAGKGRDPKVEEKYQDLSNEELFQLLKQLNPKRAEELHFNNRKRVLRALELARSGLEPEKRKDNPLYDALIIFLTDERDTLYQAINERVDQMFEEGLLEEVENLYPDKISTQALGAIGYKELFKFFDGEWTLEESKEKIKQATRNYAKRQWTWFRNREDISVIKINRNSFDQTIEEVKRIVFDFLKS